MQVLSKLPGSRFVFLGGYDMLEEAMQAPVSLTWCKTSSWGVPHATDKEDGYVSKVDGNQYVLMSKYDRNVRKLVGTDNKELAPGDSLSIVIEDKKAERLLEKAEKKAEKKDEEAEDLLVKRYWLDGKTFDPVKDVVDDLLRSIRTVTVERSDFDDTDIGRLPNRVRMTAKDPEGDFDAVSTPSAAAPARVRLPIQHSRRILSDARTFNLPKAPLRPVLCLTLWMGMAGGGLGAIRRQGGLAERAGPHHATAQDDRKPAQSGQAQPQQRLSESASPEQEN